MPRTTVVRTSSEIPMGRSCAAFGAEATLGCGLCAGNGSERVQRPTFPTTHIPASRADSTGRVIVSCRWMRKFKLILKYLFAIVFVVSGLNHFINAQFYVTIVPPYLPHALFLVYLSGVLEIILGTLLLAPKFTRAAAWGLIVLLIAVFPANIHMAVNHDLFPDHFAATLWLRLALQPVLIAWAYWYTRTDRRPEETR